jgi:argininosuccinate lyase
VRERLTLPPADEVVEYLFKPRSLVFVERDFRLMMWINLAHVLMLVRQGILTHTVGHSLIHALRELEQEGADGLTLDPRLEDLYFNMEHALIEKVGMDVGGRMHTGRSRNDLGATMTRLAVREVLVDFMGLQLGLRACLLEKATEHTGTIMPGYTHLQPAQPTTFGHYLASVALALERDAERLMAVYPRVNVNPLGACAFAGTGFPIDRAMTAHWLGFDGMVESTLDAVASRDYVSELLAAIAIMGVTLSRLAQDLYLWCSGEWGTVEVADDVAMTSSIMPQKKNPITLEHIKAKAGHLLGALVSSLAVQKGVNFMHCRDMGEAVAPLWEAFTQAQGVLHLTRRTVLGLRVNTTLMLERATQDFSTATELADVLVREQDLPFRVAHSIVGTLVTRVLQQGLPWRDVTRTMVDECAREVIGHTLALSDAQIARALDPLCNLEGKHAAGSPSAPETQRLISLARDHLARQQRTVEGWQAHHQQARQALDQELDAQLLT